MNFLTKNVEPRSKVVAGLNIKANRYGFKKYGNNQQHGLWRRIAVGPDFATSNWKMQFLHLNIPILQV